MKKILVIVCSGTFNKGTEALIRGTIILLKNAYGDIDVTLASSTPQLDAALYIPHVNSYVNRISHHKKLSFGYLRNKFKRFLNRDYKDFSDLVACAQRQDLILVVGADNYDVAYNLFPGLHQLNMELKSKCRGKLFLYDCSLNKESVTRQFIDEAKIFDAFSVREKETLGNLMGKYESDNLYYFPDPAFIMPSEVVPLPSYWETNNMIGVNLSTLIIGSEYGERLHDEAIKSYRFMIDNILSETHFNIVLIPHVMLRKDLPILEEIKDLYPSNNRVHLISKEDYTAPQIKYIISKCRFFVGARTHATIAAYSSCVPTLVLGYSTKSIGIAKDLFGKEEGYVVPVQNVRKHDELWMNLKRIMERENDIRALLTEVIPQYQQQVYSMSNLFQTILGA